MWKNIKTVWVLGSVILISVTGAHFDEHFYGQQMSGGQYDNEPIKGIDQLQLENQEINQFEPKLNSYGEFTENQDSQLDFKPSPQIGVSEEEISAWNGHGGLDENVKIIKVPVPQPLVVPIYKLVPQEIEKKVPIVVEKLVPIYVKKPIKIEIEKIHTVEVPKRYPVHVPIYRHVYVKEKPKLPKQYLIKTVKSSGNW